MDVATQQTPGDTRIKMYARVPRSVRSRFKAVAELLGETMEGRLESLMREDVEKHKDILTQSCP